MKKLKFLLVVILFISTISCSNDEENHSAKLTIVNESSSNNSDVTFTSIKIKGSIIGNDSKSISSRGICWSTNPNPTTTNNILTLPSNMINNEISNLTVNTTYYFRIFAIINNKTIYGDNITLSTLSFENTNWKFSTYYPVSQFSTGITIESTINFYDDGTTKFDEIGVGQGYFITYGTWSLNGNTLSYSFNSTDPNNPEYLYIGTLSGTTMSGTYTYSNGPGTWSAIQL